MTTEVLDGAPSVRRSWAPTVSSGRRGRRWLWIVAAVTGLAAVAAGVVVGYGTAAYAGAYDGLILPRTVVAGVDVSGLTAEEAVAAVEEVFAPELERTVSVHWGDRTWSTTPADLGATSDALDAVADAVEASAHPGWIEIARMRWLGEERAFSRDVTVTHSEQGARAFVDAVAEEVNLAPTNARLDYSSGWVQVVAGSDGRVVDTEQGAADFFEAVTTGGTDVDLPAHAVAPEVSTADFDQVVLVRQLEHRVYLYQGGQITHSWPVAVGTGDHPTPVGQFRVTAKRYMPTWVNPSPNGWGANMPASIGPGVNNPLGVRAINWDAPAIRFHGTANVNSIGTDASKGCVRLTNHDVVQLYDLVREGAAIVSVRA